MRRIVPLMVGALMLVNCATWGPVGGQYKDTKHGFHAELPEGWLKTTGSGAGPDPLYRGVNITRDGIALNRIVIGQMKAGTTLAGTQKSVQAGMLPQEASEIVLDNYRGNQNLMELEVLANTPVVVGGHDGFRLQFDMKFKSGMWRRMVFYGAIMDDTFCFLHFSAPRRHYFERDVQTFEAVVASYRPEPRLAKGP